jgi:hypothetical protein
MRRGGGGRPPPKKKKEYLLKRVSPSHITEEKFRENKEQTKPQRTRKFGKVLFWEKEHHC